MNDRDFERDSNFDPTEAQRQMLSELGSDDESNPYGNIDENDPPDPLVTTLREAADSEEGELNSAMLAATPLNGTFSHTKNNKESSEKVSDAQVRVGTNPATIESNRDDEILVQRVLGGDIDAFSLLIERYKIAVYNLCSRMLQDPDEAEDAAQEVFLRTYNQLHTYQPGRRFSTWILSIASHYCIDMLRRRKPVMDLDSIAFWKASEQPEPEESAVAGENRDEVRDLLKKLPEKYRSVTILRYWQDLSYEEIAEATGLSVATVKTRLFRARELLAKELEKRRKNGGDAGSRSDQESNFLKNRGRLEENSSKSKKVKGNFNVLP